jgi:hypothetical protein
LAECWTTPIQITWPDSGFTPETTVSSLSTAQHSIVFPPDFTALLFNAFKEPSVVSACASKPAEHCGTETVVINVQFFGLVFTTFTGVLAEHAFKKTITTE